jgi:hypothetical protein
MADVFGPFHVISFTKNVGSEQGIDAKKKHGF